MVALRDCRPSGLEEGRLVSGFLKALTESAGEFAFDAGREVELKGISGAQRVHAVEWR